MTAARLLPFLSDGPVITTNFDRVLEDVFEAAARPFVQHVWGAKAEQVRQVLGEGAHYLLKVHGDALVWEDRLLTQREYDEAYGEAGEGGVLAITPDRPLPYLLSRLLSSRCLVFLGSSLAADRTLEVLAAMARTPAAMEHFAVIPEFQEEARHRTDRRRMLGDRYHIRPIWIPVADGSGFEELPHFIEHLIEASRADTHPIPRLKAAVRSGQWSAIVPIVEQIEGVYPIDARTRALGHLAEGARLATEGSFDDACPLLDQACEIDERLAPAFVVRGGVHLLRANFPSAEQDLRHALTLNVSCPHAHRLLAVLRLLEKQDIEEIEELLSLALRDDPRDEGALELRNAVWAAGGRVAEALGEDEPSTAWGDFKHLMVQGVAFVGTAIAGLEQYREYVTPAFSLSDEEIGPAPEQRLLPQTTGDAT